MIVSELTAAGVPAVAALEASTFAHPWREADFLYSMKSPNRAVFTAMQAGALLGYCAVQWAGEQADILTIAVQPAARRRGVGAALLRAACRAAAEGGARTVFLEVRASNTAAIALYERAGFRRAGLRKGYYSDPREDGLVYSLEVI